MRANRLKDRWADGKAASNCWLTIPAALPAELLAHQGWDSLTIDMQHGHVDLAAMHAMLIALSTTDTTPLVRVSWNNPGEIMRALDAGAYGIICPCIDTVEEAERFAGACRYAPDGYRSVGPRRAALYAGADYMEKANETILSIAQIESKTALANVDGIASVKGLDMLYVGPSDLGLSLGREAKPDQTDPIVVEAIDRILASAKAHGLKAGIYCRTATYAKAMITKGFDLVTVTSDESLLAGGAAIAREFLR